MEEGKLKAILGTVDALVRGLVYVYINVLVPHSGTNSDVVDFDVVAL